MSDFHQTGCVTTLHRLNSDGFERLEPELRRYAETRPIGLVLPALYSDFETPAMRGIIDQLAHVDYVRRVVLVLAGASRTQYRMAAHAFDNFKGRVTVIWIDSGRVQNLFRLLEARGLS